MVKTYTSWKQEVAGEWKRKVLASVLGQYMGKGLCKSISQEAQRGMKNSSYINPRCYIFGPVLCTSFSSSHHCVLGAWSKLACSQLPTTVSELNAVSWIKHACFHCFISVSACYMLVLCTKQTYSQEPSTSQHSIHGTFLYPASHPSPTTMETCFETGLEAWGMVVREGRDAVCLPSSTTQL